MTGVHPATWRLPSAVLLVMAVVLPLPAQQKVEVRRLAARDVSVRVNGAFGSLRIVGWNRDSVVLTGSLPKGARLDGGVGGTADQPSRGAKFYVEQPAGEATGTLELQVPAGATVWAKAGNARIEVRGISGGLDLNIVGGAITVNGDPRELNIESMDGAVQVEGSPAWMRVKTATGDVTVRGSSQDAGFTTVGGTLTLRDGTYERVRIEAVTGNVLFAAGLARAGNLTIDSHSGAIDLVLAPKASLDIEATTIAGSILNQVTSRRPTPGREGRGEDLTLNLGAGDARATLRSFKGRIGLRVSGDR